VELKEKLAERHRWVAHHGRSDNRSDSLMEIVLEPTLARTSYRAARLEHIVLISYAAVRKSPTANY